MFNYKCQVKIHISVAPVSLVQFYKNYNGAVDISGPFNVVVRIRCEKNEFYIMEWEQENQDINLAEEQARKVLDYLNSIYSVGFMFKPISYENLTVINSSSNEKSQLRGFLVNLELFGTFNESEAVSSNFLKHSTEIASNQQLSNALYCYSEAIKYFQRYDYHKCMLELWKAIESIIGKTDLKYPIEGRAKKLDVNCYNYIEELINLKKYRNNFNIAHGLIPSKFYYDVLDIEIEDLLNKIRVVNKFLHFSLIFLLNSGPNEFLKLYVPFS